MEAKKHGLKKFDTFYLDDKNPDPKNPDKRSAGGHYNIGIDYVLGGDKLVVPWYGGTVEKAGLAGGYGYSVTVKTDRSYEYNGKRYPVKNTYSHLEYVSKGISKGTKVDTDTFIGKMGGTGSNGLKLYPEHVDFQSYIEVDGKKIQISPILMQKNFIKQSEQGTFYGANNNSMGDQISPVKSIAMQRYEAISNILHDSGLRSDNPEWNRAIVQTALATDLEIDEVKDIVKHIPGIEPENADKLVNVAVKDSQEILM